MTTWSATDTSFSIEVKLVELAMLGADVAHRAGDRAHHNGLGLDGILLEPHPREQRAGGHAGGGEQAIAAREVLDPVDHLRIVDAHLGRPRPLLVGVEDKPALHLAADATQRRRREYALGGAAGAEIHVDASIVRIGAVDDAGDVAIGDQPYR